LLGNFCCRLGHCPSLKVAETAPIDCGHIHFHVRHGFRVNKPAPNNELASRRRGFRAPAWPENA
jgi:hypothetical protein